MRAEDLSVVDSFLLHDTSYSVGSDLNAWLGSTLITMEINFHRCNCPRTNVTYYPEDTSGIALD